MGFSVPSLSLRYGDTHNRTCPSFMGSFILSHRMISRVRPSIRR
jgi:hypothetical protein